MSPSSFFVIILLPVKNPAMIKAQTAPATDPATDKLPFALGAFPSPLFSEVWFAGGTIAPVAGVKKINSVIESSELTSSPSVPIPLFISSSTAVS